VHTCYWKARALIRNGMATQAVHDTPATASPVVYSTEYPRSTIRSTPISTLLVNITDNAVDFVFHIIIYLHDRSFLGPSRYGRSSEKLRCDGTCQGLKDIGERGNHSNTDKERKRNK
jgi:hypothetical protein